MRDAILAFGMEDGDARGTIRFPFGGAIPAKLIEGIARFRAREVGGERTAKAAGLKKR